MAASIQTLAMAPRAPAANSESAAMFQFTSTPATCELGITANRMMPPIAAAISEMLTPASDPPPARSTPGRGAGVVYARLPRRMYSATATMARMTRIVINMRAPLVGY